MTLTMTKVARLWTAAACAVLMAGGANAGEAQGTNFVDPNFSAHDADPRFEEIKLLFAAEQRGIHAYRAGDFAGAHAELAAPAAKGLKIAQHVVALMYLKGEGVEKNAGTQAKGVALLGLAAESGDKAVQRQYRKALKRTPEALREVVERQVAYYVERYGMAAQGVTCKRTRKPRSHFMAVDCSKTPGDYVEHPWAP